MVNLGSYKVLVSQYSFWKQGQLAIISILFSYKTHLGLLSPWEVSKVSIHLATQHSHGRPKKVLLLARHTFFKFSTTTRLLMGPIHSPV
jgi:hypothetical protein